MKLDEPKAVRWTRADYYKMVSAGLFDGRRVELIEGEVFEMSPQDSLHASAVTLADDVVRGVFGHGYSVRVQMPLSLGEDSDPEPDIAIVAGAPRDYLNAHPSTALLVIEVASSSLSYDRTLKASLYASKGIEDYWILNLIDRQLEVRRNPRPDASQPYGFGYADITILTETDSVSPLAASQATVAVIDLLP
jgi:Uma2 family endonuclease